MQEHKALIDGCAKGDRSAQRELYNIFSGKMFMVCLRYTKSQQEAEDVLQESFIKVFKSIKNFRGDCRLQFWIKRIVVNTALNHQRKKLYMYPMVDIEDAKDAFEEEAIMSGYGLDELLSMIRELPAGCQVVFNLYAIEGYNHKEIAEKLNISEGTSKSQLSRAKKLLQGKISEEKTKHYEKFR